jgi:hypothetical protein
MQVVYRGGERPCIIIQLPIYGWCFFNLEGVNGLSLGNSRLSVCAGDSEKQQQWKKNSTH